MKNANTPRSDPLPLPPPTREQIAALAHAIWIDRGQPIGSDLDIWLEAERQLASNVAPRTRRGITDDIPADLTRSDPATDPAVASEVKQELDRLVRTRPLERSPTSL
jgi:hypothetical protein